MTANSTLAAVRTYQIDKAHSEVSFRVRHLLTKVRGRFTDFEGHVDFDAEDPTHSAVSLRIQAASIDTDEPARDTHLRSADFFAVDEFPALTFSSTAIRARGENEYDVIGTLTIRGVVRTVTMPVTLLGAARDPWGGERVAFEGDTTINRKDYGLTWNATLETGGFLVGDEVRISVSVQAVAA